MLELSKKYNCSVKTLQRKFEKYTPAKELPTANKNKVALIFDGTYFGRGYGFLIYRANKKNIYWREIDSEKIAYIEEDLLHLTSLGWQFSSFTIDGRKGVIQLLKRLFPAIPIQMCIFHQKKIITRYITLKPKTECGKEIKELMNKFNKIDEEKLTIYINNIKEKYHDFLLERNENKRFKHTNLRSAIRSLNVNKNYLFSYKKYPELEIPNTTNSCDGSFAHWKQKAQIHRGMDKDRRKKLIDFLLQNS